MFIIRCVICGAEGVNLNPDHNVLLLNICEGCLDAPIYDGFDIKATDQVLGLTKGDINDQR